MQIYWINPPISNFSVYADTAWMEISNACPSHNWIEPIIDWEQYNEIDDIIQDILDAEPDMVCFSSYIWNEPLCNDLAERLKQLDFKGVLVRGGPQQHYGHENYDYACPPLEAGEPYIVDLLNKLSGSNDPERTRKFGEGSAIVNNMVYLTNVTGKAREMSKMAVLHLETTRGCPYSCTYCEWGGGTGSKLFRKSIEIVKEEIDLVSMLKFDEIDIADANFGILDRDVDVVHMLGKNKQKYGYPKHTMIYGITKNTVANKLRVIEPLAQYKLMDNFSLPLQSLNDEVMKNIKRHDTPVKETLEMAMYIKDTYAINPRIELIMGLPGATLDDFYEEMNLVDWVKNWEWARYPFSLLPATEAAEPFYRATHKMKTAEMPLPLNDSDLSNYYRNPSIITKYRMLEEVVVESYSYTREEYIEMFFMNYAQWVIGPKLNKEERYSVQMKRVYNDIKSKEWFKLLYKELDKLTLGERDYEDFLHYDGKSLHEIVEEQYYGLNNKTH